MKMTTTCVDNGWEIINFYISCQWPLNTTVLVSVIKSRVICSFTGFTIMRLLCFCTKLKIFHLMLMKNILEKHSMAWLCCKSSSCAIFFCLFCITLLPCLDGYSHISAHELVTKKRPTP